MKKEKKEAKNTNYLMYYNNVFIPELQYSDTCSPAIEPKAKFRHMNPP
jgi:hypothetical protein